MLFRLKTPWFWRLKRLFFFFFKVISGCFSGFFKVLATKLRFFILAFKIWVMMCSFVSVELVCACCCKIFRVCRSCWRNQKYCGGDCAKNSRLLKQRRYQSKYRKTDKGILAQMRANRRYRLKNKNIVSEQTSKVFDVPAISLEKRRRKCITYFGALAQVINLDFSAFRYFSFRRFFSNKKG